MALWKRAEIFCLSFDTLMKCCVLTYPPYINLIFDIVIAHNGDEPLKDHSQETDIHAHGGIPSHNLCRRAAAYLWLRQRGLWDRQCFTITCFKLKKKDICGALVVFNGKKRWSPLAILWHLEKCGFLSFYWTRPQSVVWG